MIQFEYNNFSLTDRIYVIKYRKTKNRNTKRLDSHEMSINSAFLVA